MVHELLGVGRAQEPRAREPAGRRWGRAGRDPTEEGGQSCVDLVPGGSGLGQRTCHPAVEWRTEGTRRAHGNAQLVGDRRNHNMKS